MSLLQRGVVALADADGEHELAGPSPATAPRSSSPMMATLPSVAEPNSQSMRKLSIRSRQPSLAPTKPQLAREKPQLADMASDHSSSRRADMLAGDVDDARGVAGAAVVEMRRQQRVDLETGQQVAVAVERTWLRTTEWCGSQMISLVRE